MTMTFPKLKLRKGRGHGSTDLYCLREMGREQPYSLAFC